MEKTAKPTVAGIFMIVNGALNVILAAFFVVGVGFAMPFLDTTPGYDMVALGGIFVVGAVIGIIVSLFSIISGAYCLKRRLWGLALAGSIIATLQIIILGVPALILVAVSKQEFE